MSNNVTGYIASSAVAVTPSDDADNTYSYLYVGGSGDLSVITEAGDEVVLSGIPAGSYVWLRVSKVMDTGTGATDIVGFF